VSYSRKKIWGLLLAGLLSEAIGFVLIKRGLAGVPAFSGHSLHSLSFLIPVITSPQVLVGTAFEALHFGVLMELLSVSDVSYIIPLTSIGYVLTPLSALFFLQEKIPTLRWVGIFFVCAGVAAVSISDRSGKDHSAQSRSDMDAVSSS
jgi:drug/metabolite transporter (DMT)-like permease